MRKAVVYYSSSDKPDKKQKPDKPRLSICITGLYLFAALANFHLSLFFATASFAFIYPYNKGCKSKCFSKKPHPLTNVKHVEEKTAKL